MLLFRDCSPGDSVHFIALHVIFLHLMTHCALRRSPPLLSTGPPVVFPLLWDPSHNHVSVIFFSKREHGKVLTSDIFVILQSPLTELCQQVEGFIGWKYTLIAPVSCNLI